MNVPEDELLKDAILTEEAQSNQHDIRVPDTVLEENTTTIHRKTLPLNLVLALGDRPQPPSKSYPDFQPSLDGFGQIRVTGRKPIGTNIHHPNDLHQANPPLPRRPLEEVPPPLPTRENAGDAVPPLLLRRLQGPRPLHSRNGSVDTATLGRDLRKENVNPRRWSEQPNSLGYRGVHSDLAKGNGSNLTEYTKGPSSKALSLSITLIRRDPASGEQWNVGRILSSLASDGLAPSALDPDIRDLQDGILIELETPGYQKFCKSRLCMDNNVATSVYTMQRNEVLAPNEAQVENFCRILRPGRSKGVPNSPSPRRNEFGSSLDTSFATRPSMESSRSRSQSSNPPLLDERSSMGYYSFLSPWHSNCSFATSATGKSIKCKHILPPGLRDRPNNASLDPIGSLISELRLNLPNSNVFKLKPQEHKRPTLSKFSRSAGFYSNSQLPSRPQSGLSTSQTTNDDASSEENERMDLSLGQERAGGGFGGKKAKLGKLILEPEGFKMLDLLVAVNMAIWWKVYE